MDIIRDTESTTGYTTPRKEPQKEEKTVYFESKEISKLKRDIEAIDSLTEDKEKIVKANQNKWYYKHYTKLSKFLVAAVVYSFGMLGIVLISIVRRLFPNFETAILANFSCIILVPLLLIPSIVLDKADALKKQNQTLLKEIDYLKEIKKQKSFEIEQLKQRSTSISSSTHSSKEMISQLELYKEALTILQNMQQEPSKDTIEQVKGVIEQIEKKGKQKTIKRESLYSKYSN